jgi:hypothetical protein
MELETVSTQGLSDERLHAALGEKLSSPNSLVCGPQSFADIVVGFPELKVSLAWTADK